MEHETYARTDRGRRGLDPGAHARGHRALAHTADAGLEAWAPDPAALLVEAALALSDISADIATDVPAGVEPGTTAGVEPGATAGRSERAAHSLREDLTVEADDPESLVFAWLNELIGLIDARGAAIASVTVDEARLEDRPRARATVHLVPFDGFGVRRRNDIKSATYHQLAVRRGPSGWSLVAYLDI